MTSRAALVVTLIALLATLAGSAEAEDYRSALVRASEARDRALETGSVDDWSKALGAFETVRTIARSKEVLFEFANAATRLGLDDEAFSAYEEALSLGLTGEAAKLASKFVDENRKRMAKLALEGPTGAVVSIQGRLRGSLPLARPLTVISGSRSLSARAEGLRDWQEEITLAPGEFRTLRIEMTAANPHPAVLDPHAPARDGRPAWGPPVLIAGGALVVSGVVTIALSSGGLNEQRQKLDQSCVTLEGDECLNTTAEKHDSAQEASEQIAFLKGVRWAGIAGTALGTAGVIAGLVRILSNDEPDASAPRVDAWIGPRTMGAVGVVAF